MAAITIPASGTTLTLNGTRIGDLAEGDAIVIAPVNDATNKTLGINGGVAIKDRLDSGVADVTIRVLKFSDSDIFLNGALNQGAPVVFNGSVKRNFIRDGVDGVETYTLENGSITTKPTNTINLQDGAEAMEYVINFRNATRTL